MIDVLVARWETTDGGSYVELFRFDTNHYTCMGTNNSHKLGERDSDEVAIAYTGELIEEGVFNSSWVRQS
jgi:hypothetical protein